MAAKAVGLKEASEPEFKDYARRIVENASALAGYCVEEGMQVLTGGTDNHLMQIDVTPYGLTGRQAEGAVREARVTLNRNTLPFDSNGPWYTSGLRMGTPALTTLGMGEPEMRETASIMRLILSSTSPAKITKGKLAGTLSQARFRIDPDALEQARTRVGDLLDRFVLYPEIDVGYLQKAFA